MLWYPPGNQYQSDNGRDPVRVANFFGSPNATPTFQESIAAQQMGVAKYNALQQHIDRMARPYLGYGLGVGSFGGFF
jgi:hypothetical protein